MITAILGLAMTSMAPPADPPEKVGFEWGEWSGEAVDEALAKGRPVFVEFSADWCATCVFNRKRYLLKKEVARFFEEKKIFALRADLTQPNRKVENALKKLGRETVPAYVFYLPGEGQDVLFPEVLDPKNFLKLLDEQLKKNSKESSEGG